MHNFRSWKASNESQRIHRFEARSEPPFGTLPAMETKQPTATTHEHVTQQVHVLALRSGVPYEVEQKVCADCHRVLDETPVRRAAA